MQASPLQVPTATGTSPQAGTNTDRPRFPPNPGDDVFDTMRHLPARIDLSPGLPDLAAFPRAAWLEPSARY